MAVSGSLEDRLTELEMRLAFVDDTVNSLNETVTAHDRHLRELLLAMDRLRGDLVAARDRTCARCARRAAAAALLVRSSVNAKVKKQPSLAALFKKAGTRVFEPCPNPCAISC